MTCPHCEALVTPRKEEGLPPAVGSKYWWECPACGCEINEEYIEEMGDEQ